MFCLKHKVGSEGAEEEDFLQTPNRTAVWGGKSVIFHSGNRLSSMEKLHFPLREPGYPGRAEGEIRDT